jgi:hypothetical protein
MVGAPLKTPTPPTPPAPKPKASPPQREAGASPRKNGVWAPIVRVIVSVVVVWHFFAVFLAALSVPGPTSTLVNNIAQSTKSPVHWYLQALYLNQGHSFFAPEVGCGYLVTYDCYDANGQIIEKEKGELPSRDRHWPRLLYHRYFMLASQAGFDHEMKQVRDETQKAYLDAYGRHLLYANKDAQAVRLRRFAHWPVPINYAKSDRKKGYDNLMQQSARGGEPRQIDAQGYEFLGETVVRRSEIEPEARQQAIYQNGYVPNYAPETANRWTGGRR